MQFEEGREKQIREIFRFSVFLKAANAILETIGGGLLLSGSLIGWVRGLVEQQIAQDPGDFASSFLQHILPYLSSHAQFFAAWYLLSHGVIKLFLAIGLLRNQLWAYPSAIAVFVFFVVYQVYRYTYTHSPLLLLITFFDVLVIGLTWHEYTVVKNASKKVL